MRLLRSLGSGMRSLFGRPRLDANLDDELRDYIEHETQRYVDRGLSPEKARTAALRDLGGLEQLKEECRDTWTFAAFETLERDIHFGLRQLRRNPGFAAVAILTLGLGIGANVAVFSVVNSVLLRPLAYPDAGRLVAVWQKAPGAEGLMNVSGDLRLSASMYFTYAEQNRTLEALGVWAPGTSSVTGFGEPQQVRTVAVSDGVLQALAVPPVAGRWLLAADQKPGAPATVLLSYGYWQQRFGGERSAIGRSILVDSQPSKIVGVMPASFRIVNAESDLILPLAFERSKLTLPGFGYQGVARLKPGVTIAQANADIARLVPVWMNSWPMVRGVDPHVFEIWRIAPALRPLKQDVIGGISKVLWTLMATIGMVMLIACANVANLLLVRAEARRQELAVRVALGAGGGRLIRALLAESLLLGVMGGVLGMGLAYLCIRMLVEIGPASLPRLGEISLDSWALAFAFALSVLSGLLLGFMPAWKYARPRAFLELRGGGRTHSAAGEQHRVRNALVVVQVALALVLLLSSVLMLRTFQALRSVDPGFTHPEQVLTVQISIPEALVREPERAARMQNDIIDKLSAIPGVTSAAFSSELPMESTNHDWDVVCVENDTIKGSESPPLKMFKHISPGLFRTIGTKLMAGRDFTWSDLYGRRPVGIVSQNFAHEKWGAPSAALGKRISTCIPGAPEREIVGVVEDVRDNGVQEAAPAIVYWPSFGESLYPARQVTVQRGGTFAIRSKRAGEQAFLNQVSKAVWSVNASLPLASVGTLEELYNESMARASFALVMLGIGGIMAVLLGIIGIYGVISYVVSQRRREMGIRLALGAQRGELRRLFVRYGLKLAAAGVGIGWAAAAGLTRLMKSLLFGISPLDPLTYAVVPIVLVTAALFASYVPARRAAAVDPVETLRAE